MLVDVLDVVVTVVAVVVDAFPSEVLLLDGNNEVLLPWSPTAVITPGVSVVSTAMVTGAATLQVQGQVDAITAKSGSVHKLASTNSQLSSSTHVSSPAVDTVLALP